MTTREIKLEDLPKVPPQQLSALIQQFEGEIKFFQQSLAELKSVVTTFKKSQDAVNDMAEMGENKECLVPLTDTIYVNGRTGTCEKFLIDIGTGYYAEMTPEEANMMFSRKREFVENQIKQIEGNLLPNKKMALELTSQALQKKIAEAQAAAGGGGSNQAIAATGGGGSK